MFTGRGGEDGLSYSRIPVDELEWRMLLERRRQNSGEKEKPMDVALGRFGWRPNFHPIKL